MNETLEYYSHNANNFISTTIDVDMSEIQKKFISYLAPNSTVLDFGCGSGRDSLVFLKNGFYVEAIDACMEFCDSVKKLTEEFSSKGKIIVKQMRFNELCEKNKYNGIWACASLLHVSKKELPDLLKKIENALLRQGIFYCSFKEGTFEGPRNGRYFSDFKVDEIILTLQKSTNLNLEKFWITNDARPNHSEKWINLLLKKL